MDIPPRSSSRVQTLKNKSCFQLFYKTWLIRLIFCTGEDPSDVARPYGLCDSTLAADQYRLVDPENTYNLSHNFLNIVQLILMWAYLKKYKQKNVCV